MHSDRAHGFAMASAIRLFMEKLMRLSMHLIYSFVLYWYSYFVTRASCDIANKQFGGGYKSQASFMRMDLTVAKSASIGGASS